MKRKLPSTCLIVVDHLSYFTNSSNNTTKPSTKISKKFIAYLHKQKQKQWHTSSPSHNVDKSNPLMKYTSLKDNQHESSTTSMMKFLNKNNQIEV